MTPACQAQPSCPAQSVTSDGAHRHDQASATAPITQRAATDSDPRRGGFSSVKDLIAAIETFIDGWYDRCQPFTWTKTADELLPRSKPGKRTSSTRH